MKKFLGILLAFSILLSSAFLGMNFTSVDAGELSTEFTVTAGVREQGGGAVLSDRVQSVPFGQQATVSAKPYYANGFLGWYEGDNLVSKDLDYTFTPTANIELTAAFDIKNAVINGDAEIESEHGKLLDALNNPAVKYDANYYGTAEVVSTNDILNTTDSFGDYAIKITPSASTNAAKVKDLVNIPLTVEKNTDYILRFSYKFDDNVASFDKSRSHYIHLALNGPDANGKIQFNDTDHTIKWTYHSHPSGTEIADSVGAFKNTWAWGGYDGFLNDNGTLIGKFISDNGTANDDQWQDVYLLFNPKEDADVFRNGDKGTIYVSLGTHYSTTDFLLLDNLSLSKAENNSFSTVTATSGGNVKSNTYRSGENYYVYTTGARGGATTFTGRDKNNLYYPSIYESFTATAEEGSSFIGWFDENDECVSRENTAYLLMTGKRYTAKFAKGLSAEGGGYIENNGDGTYTAHAYYGNKFLGWFDGTVSPYVHKTDDLTVNKDESLGYVAVFTNDNLIIDGDFETNSETANIYNEFQKYDDRYSGTYSIVPTCIEGSGAQFGDYCLQVMPNTVDHAAERKGMLNIPVELEAGKRYLWKFSYAIVASAYNASYDYLTFSVDTAAANGKIPWDSNADGVGMVDYSFHAQLSTATEINKSDWAWGNYESLPYAYSDNKNISGANVWVDMYVVIDAQKSETHYLSLGAFEGQKNAYLFDNMSLTEVKESPENLAEVKISGNGFVSSYRADEAAYKTNMVKGTAGIFENGVEINRPLYPDMYVDYYAAADVGFVFDGWYNTADGSCISKDESVRIKLVSDEKIEARFSADTKQYNVNAVVESQNGIYGGYITSASEYSAVTSGDSVTFTAAAYRGNKFSGWYEGDKLVSADATFTYTVRKNTTLKAKFDTYTLFTDAGYENTPLGTTVSGDALEWQGDASVAVVGNEVFDGKHSILLSGSEINRLFALDKNKEYYLSFQWKSANGALEYVKVSNINGGVLAQAETLNAINDWVKLDLNFNSADCENIKLEIKFSGSENVYLDDFVLYDLSKLPLDITAKVEEQNGIFGGYIEGDKHFSVDFGTEITVKAVPYVKNSFLGWYDGETLVSTDAEYTFNAKNFQNLKARFDIKNLWHDSGYENTTPDVSLSENGLWKVDSKLHEMYDFDVTVTNKADAFSGKQMLSALHRNTTFSTTVNGLLENTDYFLTFRVRTRKTLDNCFFQSAKLLGAAGEVLGTGFGTANGGQWEYISVPFNSGKNTEITVEFIYSAGEQECYFDDFALFESHNIGVYANEGGSVTSTLNGGENGPAASGTAVTVTATPEGDNTFLGWYDYLNSTVLLSKENPYTFNVNKTQHIVAKFEGENVPPENMVVDGDFENGCFQGFKFAGYNNADCSFCTYQVTKKTGNVTPVSGDYMVKVAANSRNTNLIVKNLKPHTDYTVSFDWLGNEYIELYTVAAFKYMAELEGFVSQDDGGATKQQSKHLHANGTMIRAEAEEYVYVNGKGDGKNWRRVEFSFNTDNRDAAIIFLNYSRYGGSDGLYLDNIRVFEDGHYSDFAENGNFESENTVKGFQGEFTVKTDGANKYGSSSSVMYNGINMEAVKGYKVSFKAKSESGARLLYGVAESGAYALKSGERIKSMTNASYGTATLTNDWKEYTLYFQSIGYRQGNLVFESANGKEFAIDDVVFERADRLVPVNRLTFENTEEKDIINSAYKSIIGKPELDQKNVDWYEYSTVAHSGSGSLLMKYKSEYASHELSQPWSSLNLESGRSYRVSLWAKAEKAGTKFMSGVAATNTKFESVFLSENVYTLDDTNWKKFSFTFNTEDLWYAASCVASFVVNGVENETTCDIWFDDIVIEEWTNSAIGASDKLYTEDISQNYFGNFSFEKQDAAIAPYVVSGGASLGDKCITLKAGDRVIIPVSTRTDYNLAYNCVYTFAADVRSKGATGFIGLSYSSDGKELMCDKDGKPISLSLDTNGEWKRQGFNFTGNRNETEYLVLECYEGSFSVDYIALFNATHAFAESTIDNSKNPSKDEIEYVDMNDRKKINFLSGKLSGLPAGSLVVLKGETDYETVIDAYDEYFISDIENGSYKMYIVADGEEIATLLGDITFKDGTFTGLATTRLNGEVINITGTGVPNGIVKVTDKDAGYAYMTATTDDGEFSIYILDCEWELDGVTSDKSAMNSANLSASDFTYTPKNANAPSHTVDFSKVNIPFGAIVTLLSAAALIVLTFKKGECR